MAGGGFHPAQVRGSLYERDNIDQTLTFHYNPTEMTFEKEADYVEESTRNDYIQTLTLQKVHGLVVKFDLFLDEWDPVRVIDRSVESSLGWLFNRMGPAAKDEAASDGTIAGGNGRSGSWLDFAQRMASRESGTDTVGSPVLVLGGMRTPFTCLLTKCSAKALLRRPNVVPAVSPLLGSQQQMIQAQIRATTVRGPWGVPLQAQSTSSFQNAQDKISEKAVSAYLDPKPGDIVRAVVSVTLREFVGAPPTL
jgi:hypothetical protein